MSVVINGSAGVTTNSGAVYNGIASGTAVASTSGTSIDFTSIPSWVKRITVMFDNVSLNGGSEIQVQLGDSGGVETTGYSGAYAFCGASQAGATFSSGFVTFVDQSSGQNLCGSMVLTLLGSNTWTMTCVAGIHNGNYVNMGGGAKTLSATLDRVRITTVNGTDTFDAGSINIIYE